MKPVYLFTILVAVACSQKEATKVSTGVDSTILLNQAASIKPYTIDLSQVNLTDTLLNEHTVKFYELSLKLYDSIKNKVKATKLILKPANNYISKLDSCILISLQNQKKDSLCNMNDGEYYEKYLVKGFWPENKLLLAHFENWEESHDFFISLKDGSHYLLAANYEVSPQRNMILTYSDIIANPIYPSELMVSQIENGVFTTLYKKDLGQTTITEAHWISNSACLLATSSIDFEANVILNRKWYRMTIE